MTHLVRRTCTEIAGDSRPDRQASSSRPLEEFRETAAYVMLGAPGAGKTKAFEQEAAACPTGHYVTARDFVTFDFRPEWRDAILFVDGLDEMRAGAVNGRTPFDHIRSKLDRLGRPRFRLSCREAHWFGAIDRAHLESVSLDARVTVLRLDPLSGDDVREILRRRSDIPDADEFMAKSGDRGVDGFLANPQSLRMLAVAGGVWPETRMRTFELACRRLVREHDKGHRIATPQFDDASRLLREAGRLCAVQLLAGSVGYTRVPSDTDDCEFPDLGQVPGDDRCLLHHVLGTKLFDAPHGDTSQVRAAPVHRHVAEFLAARYLAALVEDGLPIGRILSLITGHDGGVVSELRGLAAWLASHSKSARSELIARDALGTVLYGDIRDFSTNEKHQVLDGVARETAIRPWITGTLAREPRLADLATPDMADLFGRELSESARGHARQSLALLLLAALGNGQAMPQLADRVAKIVRDDTWLPGVRTAALQTLIRHGRSHGQTAQEYRALLADIDAGTISDPDDDLLGLLLTELYPGELSVRELLQSLRAPRNPSPNGNYFSLWIDHVPDASTTEQLSDLLDSIVENFDSLRPTLVGTVGDINYLHLLPIRLLKQVIQASEEEIPIDRLFEWLQVVSDPELRISPRDSAFIRPWLERHPDVLKAVIELAADRCSGSSHFSRCMHRTDRVLFRAPWPPDWSLGKAMAATDRNVAEYFIYRVADFVHSNPHDKVLTRDEVARRLAANVALMDLFNRRWTLLDESISLESDIQEQDDKERRQRQRKWRKQVGAHERELRENRCPPGLLHNLAAAYFGHFVDVEGETPLQRLRNLLGNEESLIQAVQQGLRDSPKRDDRPTGADIMRLGSQNKTHYLAWPILAGLEADTDAKSSPGLALDGELMRLALAIHYTVSKPFAARRSPSWFSALLTSHPDVVADVLVQSTLSRMHDGTDFSANLYDLVHSSGHENVARLASLPLLRKFPVRCQVRHLASLNYLLQAALIHCERAHFLELVDRKLAHRSMNVAQRVYWLAAGLIASPKSFTEDLDRYVSANERRIRHLAEFAVGRFRLPESLLTRLEVPALRILIRLTGSSFRPFSPRSGATRYQSEEGGQVTDGLEAGLGIAHLIDRLASLPSRNATDALEELSSDLSLRSWSAHLVDAAHRQNVLRREHAFRHSGIARILEVLDNGRPANAADLAALIMSCLRDMATRLRDGNTSDWRQYWNVDSYNRPLVPKPENACRDALLSDLQARLAHLHIDAAPGGGYADDKRSDIRVSHGGFNVPVEIKKADHRELWSAIRTQLIAKYARDPDSGGHGIYLVFWHGTGKCQPPESGTIPRNAAELEERLRGTLSTEETRLISVLVIDVSKRQE